MSCCKRIQLLCELMYTERSTAWQGRDYTEGSASVAGLSVETGMEMPPVGNTVRKETADPPFAAETWSCLPLLVREQNGIHISVPPMEYRLDTVRTSERLNLTEHPWSKGQTGPGQWKEANNSNISAWGLSLGALDKGPGVHVGNWNTRDTSLWNAVTGGSLTGTWYHTE